MSERKSKWYYKNKLARLGYPVEGLDLHQLKELNEEHKKKLTISKEPIIKEVKERLDIDRDVEEFYKAFEESEKPEIHISKPYDGLSPLIHGKIIKSIKYVDLDGREIKPVKKEDIRIWKL